MISSCPFTVILDALILISCSITGLLIVPNPTFGLILLGMKIGRNLRIQNINLDIEYV